MIKFHICRAQFTASSVLNNTWKRKKRNLLSKWKPTCYRIRDVVTAMRKSSLYGIKKSEVVNHIWNRKITFNLGINYYLGLKESLFLSSTCPIHFTFSSVWLKYSFLALWIQSLLLYVSDLKWSLQQRECFWEEKSNEKNIVKPEDIQRMCCDWYKFWSFFLFF